MQFLFFQKLKRLFSSVLMLGVFYCLPLLTRANNHQEAFQGPEGTRTTARDNVTEFQNPIRFDSLQEFFARFLEILVQIAFPFLLLAVIYTGFLFVKAQGNTDKLGEAKRMLLWTIVGAVIILGAAAIAELIQGTVNEIVNP